jgi:Iron/manganese superoxide dismutases, C-terminal domain
VGLRCVGLRWTTSRVGCDHDFGGLEKFKEQFLSSAVGQFGSGWAWLVADKNELKVVKTGNAMTPIAHGQKPLLTCDVSRPDQSSSPISRRRCGDRPRAGATQIMPSSANISRTIRIVPNPPLG